VADAFDEWVDIEEIIDATKIYALAAMSWCGYSLRSRHLSVRPLLAWGSSTNRDDPFTGF
jgi:hypothetical protein